MQPAKGSGHVSPKSRSPNWRRSPRLKDSRINSSARFNAKEEVKSKARIGLDSAFEDHVNVSQRMAKSLYFANKFPSTPRPSLPLTVLAVKSFTTEVLGNTDTLEFLDLELASQIGRNACVSPTALIMALVYLERLSNNNPTYLSSIKPSELFVISLLVASKFIQDDGEDSGIYNDEWAASANLDLKHVNKLEIQFLDAINWNVNVNLEEFETALAKVERKLALNQGLRRGWFTYTEVEALANLALSWSVLGPVLHDYVLKVISAACMAYTTVLATLLGSSILGPQIFALTKTMLISSTIFQAPTSLQPNRGLCTSMCGNDSFQATSRLHASDIPAAISILNEKSSRTFSATTEPNESDIMQFLSWNNELESDTGTQYEAEGIQVLMNPLTDYRKHQVFAGLGKYLLNLNELPGTKRLFFETLSSLPGEEIS